MIDQRQDWTGHNFPSEGWKPNAGSTVTWFRWINARRFMFTLWLNGAHKATYIQCMDTTGPKSQWHIRHHFSL